MARACSKWGCADELWNPAFFGFLGRWHKWNASAHPPHPANQPRRTVWRWSCREKRRFIVSARRGAAGMKRSINFADSLQPKLQQSGIGLSAFWMAATLCRPCWLGNIYLEGSFLYDRRRLWRLNRPMQLHLQVSPNIHSDEPVFAAISCREKPPDAAQGRGTVKWQRGATGSYSGSRLR